MSFEIAFRVKPDTDFHKKYFRMQEEKEKFKTKAKAFFQEQGFEQPVTYGIAKRLHIRLSESDFAKFGSQCCSMPDRSAVPCRIAVLFHAGSQGSVYVQKQIPDTDSVGKSCSFCS